jgi:hypothetical protein
VTESTLSTPAPQAAELLVCVYYRVAGGDTASAIARVRDIQRTLADRFDGLKAEVLVRCEARAGLSPPAQRDSGASSAPAPAADDTLMETYRLPLPADPARPSPGTAIDAPEAARLLGALESACAPLAPLLRGARHVEVFMPCAS